MQVIRNHQIVLPTAVFALTSGLQSPLAPIPAASTLLVPFLVGLLLFGRAAPVSNSSLLVGSALLEGLRHRLLVRREIPPFFMTACTAVSTGTGASRKQRR